MTTRSPQSNSRHTYVFAGAAVLFAIGLSVAQNLKLLPNQQGFGPFVDLLHRNHWAAIWVVVVCVVAASAVGLAAKKCMGRLVACALAAVTGACCFIQYEPAMGAALGCVVGGIVASTEFRNALFGALWLVLPALGVGVLGAMAWRDLAAPFRMVGPLFCVSFLAAYVWCRWPRPFRVRIFVPCAITAVLVWFGLTIDTFCRTPSPEGLIWNSDPVKCLTMGMFDVQEVWGVSSHKQLRRLSCYGNIRFLDLDKSIGHDVEGVKWIRNPGGVVHLGICSSHLSATSALPLQRFVGLQRLWLWGTKVDESVLANLKPMTRLSTLMLGRSEISDESLRDLVNVPSLMTLDLHRTAVSDNGLENLRGHPGLTRVSLQKTNVTGTGVPSLVTGQWALTLNLRETKVTDETASHLVSLRQIAEVQLDLSDTAIGDEALVPIGQITTLTQLNLAGTNVSDAGLKRLTGLTALVSLDISETKCTPAGIRELEAALPTLDVNWFE